VEIILSKKMVFSSMLIFTSCIGKYFFFNSEESKTPSGIVSTR